MDSMGNYAFHSTTSLSPFAVRLAVLPQSCWSHTMLATRNTITGTESSGVSHSDVMVAAVVSTAATRLSAHLHCMQGSSAMQRADAASCTVAVNGTNSRMRP